MVDEVRGADGTSRRTRVLVVVALVLVVVGLAADRWRLDQERAALMGTVERAEGTVRASLDSLLSLADYAGPLLTTEDVPADSRGSALATLSRDAARWVPRVRTQQELLDDDVVLPWHGDLRAARAAYALRLATWAELLAAVERDPETFLGGSDGEARDARTQAVDALLTAGADPARVRRLLGSGAVAREGRAAGRR